MRFALRKGTRASPATAQVRIIRAGNTWTRHLFQVSLTVPFLVVGRCTTLRALTPRVAGGPRRRCFSSRSFELVLYLLGPIVLGAVGRCAAGRCGLRCAAFGGARRLYSSRSAGEGSRSRATLCVGNAFLGDYMPRLTDRST